MRYYIRNYTKLKQVISTDVLSKIATEYMADYYTKKFFFKNHLDFLLLFQLTMKESLKEMVDHIGTNKKLQQYIPEVSVSQVSRDNESQDYTMFAEIFYYLVDIAIKSKRIELTNEEKKYVENIKILDSTLIRLCLKYLTGQSTEKTSVQLKSILCTI